MKITILMGSPNKKCSTAILAEEFKRGVLLPDIEGVDTIEQQIEIAKKKAGIVEDEYNIEKFTVIRHK